MAVWAHPRSLSARRRLPPRAAATAKLARARATPRATCSRCRRRGADRRAPRPRGERCRLTRTRDTSSSISVSVDTRSGPRRETYRRSRVRRGPFHCVASQTRPRSASHGSPRRRVSGPRCATRHRPFIRRWLRSTTPPSKWRNRFLPTASTRSSTRPSTARATPVASPRGFGLSASRRSPTRTWSRCAVRWRESPSGTGQPPSAESSSWSAEKIVSEKVGYG